MTDQLNKEYFNNPVFDSLKDLSGFYRSLSFGTFPWVQQGIEKTINIDSYTFSSIQATLESIELVLSKGKINDAFALLRKYFDSVIINIYTSLYLLDHFSIENFVVKQINDWKNGKARLPKTQDMVHYIIKSSSLAHITKHIDADMKYKEIRDRCNDHMHYNYFLTFAYNDANIYLPDRTKYLNLINSDLKNIFVLHLACEFSVCPHYMMSSDYSDHMDVGQTPPGNCEYWVAPYIQKVFEKYVKKVNPRLSEEFRNHTRMELQ